MTKQYTDLQLLRSLVDANGLDAIEPSRSDQTVIDVITWLTNQSPGSDAYEEVFDIVAQNFTDTLWDFS